MVGLRTAGQRASFVHWASTTILFVALAYLFLPLALGGHTSYVIVSGTSMEPGLHTGDLVLARPAAHYEPGQTVAYRVPKGEPGEGFMVIHRIVGTNADGTFLVQGDNKQAPDQWHPAATDVVGRRWVMVPQGGRWLLWLRNPIVFGGLVASLTVASLLMHEETPTSRRSRRTAGAPAETA